MSDGPAVPALSQRALLGERGMCGGMSEVQHFSSQRGGAAVLHVLPLTFSYFRGFPEDGTCKPCSPECASCQGSSSKCLSCEQQYLLQDHSCRSQCLKGYYPTGGECQRCPAQCSTCTQEGLCTGQVKQEKRNKRGHFWSNNVWQGDLDGWKRLAETIHTTLV